MIVRSPTCYLAPSIYWTGLLASSPLVDLGHRGYLPLGASPVGLLFYELYLRPAFGASHPSAPALPAQTAGTSWRSPFSALRSSMRVAGFQPPRKGIASVLSRAPRSPPTGCPNPDRFRWPGTSQGYPARVVYLNFHFFSKGLTKFCPIF